MNRREVRKRLLEITNTDRPRPLKRHDPPEICTVLPEDAVIDLDVVDLAIGDGVFDDYQIECPEEFNLHGPRP